MGISCYKIGDLSSYKTKTSGWSIIGVQKGVQNRYIDHRNYHYYGSETLKTSQGWAEGPVLVGFNHRQVIIIIIKNYTVKSVPQPNVPQNG